MIRQTYVFHVPMEKVWQALTDPKLIERWSGAPADMRAEEGVAFKLWNGDIWGTNTRVHMPDHLEQDWFGGKWNQPSKVCMALTEKAGQTTLDLCHSDVPENEEKDFADGWRDEYFGPLQKLVEATA